MKHFYKILIISCILVFIIAFNAEGESTPDLFLWVDNPKINEDTNIVLYIPEFKLEKPWGIRGTISFNQSTNPGRFVQNKPLEKKIVDQILLNGKSISTLADGNNKIQFWNAGDKLLIIRFYLNDIQNIEFFRLRIPACCQIQFLSEGIHTIQIKFDTISGSSKQVNEFQYSSIPIYIFKDFP
jgi:hypothetical protein